MTSGSARIPGYHLRAVNLSQRAQILRRARYALTSGKWDRTDRILLALAANGRGSLNRANAEIAVALPVDDWWHHVRDSNQQGLRQLAFTLALIDVPEKLPRNAAAPPPRA